MHPVQPAHGPAHGARGRRELVRRHRQHAVLYHRGQHHALPKVYPVQLKRQAAGDPHRESGDRHRQRAGAQGGHRSAGEDRPQQPKPPINALRIAPSPWAAPGAAPLIMRKPARPTSGSPTSAPCTRRGCWPNVYYWNKLFRNHGLPDRYPMHVPHDWAVEIVGEAEFQALNALAADDACRPATR